MNTRTPGLHTGREFISDLIDTLLRKRLIVCREHIKGNIRSLLGKKVDEHVFLRREIPSGTETDKHES